MHVCMYACMHVCQPLTHAASRLKEQSSLEPHPQPNPQLQVRLPLGPLMDGRMHTYTLPLADPEGKSQADGGIEGTTITFELAFDD